MTIGKLVKMCFTDERIITTEVQKRNDAIKLLKKCNNIRTQNTDGLEYNW